jgi:hypothetical protein
MSGVQNKREVIMPEVMLKRDWPGTFRRTVASGKRSTVLNFEPGVPVELTGSQLDSLKSDIGVALMPCERDEKGLPRIITDEVVSEHEEANVTQSV